MISNKDTYGMNAHLGGFVHLNGIQMYYESYGKGEPLLLIHGTGQSINAFRFQIPYFEKYFKVIVMDCRGRGLSTDTNEELTYTLQASDIKKLMDALHISSAHVVGWSDGGIIGVIMAINYPEKVQKLVAMGSNIHPEGLFPERLASHKAEYKRLKAKKDPENTTVIKLYKLLAYYPKLSFEDLNVIKSPTLIMAGDHDVIQDQHTVQMFQAIPNAHLAILPGQTHMMPTANPDLFNTSVLAFMQNEFVKPKRY
ncbi:alpha/beta fold hydrolase [Ascidiimonas sp. W6]|uniref:alpha/beta fold hydrolase n=1 Tax=Ascidiimonas meishanensis TaxID=3128903 RepID=UPI0030EE4C0F